MKKKRVLFVGSFVDKAKDGSVGGQMFACKSLINSDLSNEVDWILLDTTGNSVPPPPLFFRMLIAITRVFKFSYLLLIKRPDFTLIFSANVPSIYEKGLMILISNLFRVKSILAPRGGPLVTDVKNDAIAAKFVPYILSKSNYVICQGKFWKNFFEEIKLPKSQTQYLVIPNWIDLANCKFKLSDNLSEAEFTTILFMGWIQEDKGIFDLFNALESEILVTKKLKVIYLGDGPGKKQLIENTNTLKHNNHKFEFPGWVHGNVKSNYLNQADIFVLPSYSEGMPNSLMEAMATGVASIATNVGAVPELIKNNETGIIVEVNDVNAISKGILFLIENPKEKIQMIIKAREKIERSNSLLFATYKLGELLKKE